MQILVVNIAGTLKQLYYGLLLVHFQDMTNAYGPNRDVRADDLTVRGGTDIPHNDHIGLGLLDLENDDDDR